VLRRRYRKPENPKGMCVFTDNTVGEQAAGFQPEAARNPAIFNAENSHGENKSDLST